MMNSRTRNSLNFNQCAPRFCLILLLLSLLPLPLVHADKASDEFQLAIGLYKQNRWELATERFQKYLKDYPTDASVPLAKFYLGLTLVNQQIPGSPDDPQGVRQTTSAKQ